jgi:autotransporter-associated beta strand protein
VRSSGGTINGVGGTMTLTTTGGTTTLTGINTYSGNTTVDAGVLAVNGSIATSTLTTVNAGGTLGGNGTVGNTTINGGALAPGNSIGLLTVQGSLVFTAASSYMVEVSPVNADRTNVTGMATLGGASINVSFAAGTYVAKQYTILNATGGVSGTFGAEVNSNLPANFHTSLSYDANNAYLNLLLNFAVPTGLTGNQQNVGNALTNFFNTTGGIPLVFGALSPAGLTQASGEVATGSQQTTFDAMGLFMGLLTDPFVAGRGDPVSASSGAPQFAQENDGASAYADNGKPRTRSERDAYAAIYRKAPAMAGSFAQRWSVWAAGYGGSQTTDGNAGVGSNTATSRIYGTAVGADYRFSPFTLAGFALAGGGTNFSVANGLGSGRSDLFQAGAFLRHTVGPAYISAALAYGWQDITTDRTITIAGVDQLRAKFNANAFSGRVEGGYRFVMPWMGITPYAAGQFTTFDLPAYAEQAVTGANTFALAYASKSVTDTRSELGLRSDKSYAMQDGIFTLRGRVAWAHDFNPDRSIGATFQTLPGASFVVGGAAQASDSALVTASAEQKWLNGWSAAATFEGEFSEVTRSYAGKGVVRYAW